MRKGQDRGEKNGKEKGGKIEENKDVLWPLTSLPDDCQTPTDWNVDRSCQLIYYVYSQNPTLSQLNLTQHN